MRAESDLYFKTAIEPYRSCLLFLRSFILNHSPEITETWSFNTPFYKFRNRSIGFISYDPKTKDIYISFTNGNKITHPALLAEGRKKMKIFRVDPEQDIDVDTLREILTFAVEVIEGAGNQEARARTNDI